MSVAASQTRSAPSTQAWSRPPRSGQRPGRPGPGRGRRPGPTRAGLGVGNSAVVLRSRRLVQAALPVLRPARAAYPVRPSPGGRFVQWHVRIRGQIGPRGIGAGEADAAKADQCRRGVQQHERIEQGRPPPLRRPPAIGPLPRKPSWGGCQRCPGPTSGRYSGYRGAPATTSSRYRQAAHRRNRLATGERPGRHGPHGMACVPCARPSCLRSSKYAGKGCFRTTRSAMFWAPAAARRRRQAKRRQPSLQQPPSRRAQRRPPRRPKHPWPGRRRHRARSQPERPPRHRTTGAATGPVPPLRAPRPGTAR